MAALSYHSISNLMQPSPLYEMVGEAPKEEIGDGDEKICRICLETDLPHLMIAPCSCKGSSKWVHRFCLDQWRATNQDAIAFSKCTECLFDYHMEAAAGRQKHIKYCLLVSHDIGLATLAVQLLVALLGLFVWLADQKNRALTAQCETNVCVYGTYYVAGLLLLLVGLGFYGLILLCTNNCSVSQSMAVMLEDPNQIHQRAPPPPPATDSMAPMNETLDRSTQGGSTDKDVPLLVPNQYRPPPSYRRQAMRHHDSRGYYCPDCYYCYCPGCDSGPGDCGTGGCAHHGCNAGDGGDGVPVMVVILAVVAIVLAIIGIFVGVMIAVVVIQRILEKHVSLMQKRRLVRDFRVKDLSNYPLDLERSGEVVVPSAPMLPEEDVSQLKKLGLMK
jgi:hypothetical protein